MAATAVARASRSPARGLENWWCTYVGESQVVCDTGGGGETWCTWLPGGSGYDVYECDNGCYLILSNFEGGFWCPGDDPIEDPDECEEGEVMSPWGECVCDDGGGGVYNLVPSGTTGMGTDTMQNMREQADEQAESDDAAHDTIEASAALSDDECGEDDGGSCEDYGTCPPPPPTYECGGNVMDARDSIRTEYDSTALFTGQYKPACTDIVANVQSPAGHFSWSELSASIYHGMGVFTSAMLSGADAVRTRWVDSTAYSGLVGSSFCRCPRKNADIGSTALQSRHMYGDAVDFDNPAYPNANSALSDSTWKNLFRLAGQVSGATVLNGTQDPKCSVSCVHVDWR
jgi:hypothetical protein